MKTTKIYLDDYPYYLRKMKNNDFVHFKMSIDDFDDDNTAVSVFHVGQVRQQPYYSDLLDWLRGEYEINGNKYYKI